MIHSDVRNVKWKAYFRLSYFVIVVGVIALLLGGVAIAYLFGGALGKYGLYVTGAVIGALMIATMMVVRQYELVAVSILAVNIYVDWYLGLYVVWLAMAITLLFIFFLNRSFERPWTEPPVLGLWLLFLTLTIFPAVHGALTLRDALFYWPNLIFGALICFWLGTVLARNSKSVRRFFQMLSILGVLIAVHTIIQATTGKTLLESSNAAAYLNGVSNYELTSNGSALRYGSFFTQPNYCGAFLAMMVFISLGLYVGSSSFFGKIVYLVEILLLLTALLFTYSADAWLSTLVGIFAFLVFVGNQRARVQILLCIIAGGLVLLVGFSGSFSLLLQHATDPQELIIRKAVWQTALRVIQAFPLTGIGLGQQAYLLRAEPFRVIGQDMPYDQPHNSYLEWAAMAGIPVLLIFLALLMFALWLGLRNWVRADRGTRSLLGTGIALTIVLCINSWANEGWTLPSLAAIGWMVLGIISSPLLTNKQDKEEIQMKPIRVNKFLKRIAGGGSSD